MATITVLALWHLRHDTLNSNGRELSLLSLATTDAIERGLRGAEEGMQALRAELEEGRLSLDDQLPQVLHTRAELMPLVQTLWVLNGSGQRAAGSDTSPAPDAASFFPALVSLPEQTLALSRTVSPARPGAEGAQEMVSLALRFTKPQGGGWIVAAMPVRSLLGGVGRALPDADARLVVLRRDGERLAAINALAQDGAGGWQAANADRPAGLSRQTLADGSDNLVAGQPAGFGVQVQVSRDLTAALETWRQAAELAALVLTTLLLVMAAAVYFVQLADRRRLQAQAALQAQVSRAGKLESLGTLAGGVAHDFNNVLAGIVGFGEMAQDAATPGSAQARHLDKMMQAALRGTALVERILAFSRGGAKTSTVFELEPVVDEVLTLMTGSLRSGIVLERALLTPGACLKGDATQAFEAVMNLCTNAMQAMPEGGKLSVRLVRETIGVPRVLSHTQLLAGDYLALSVADQGSGISPEVMEHLFEPFFTTKAAQSGTGLGLAVVFGVVAELGGAVDVHSSPGQGARFTLYLPECKEGTEAPAEDLPAVRAGAGQRILVVDDEPELVEWTVELLQRLGYAPAGFSDAAAALAVLQQQPDGFAAVITDEVMPGITGTQLTQALRQAASNVPVLLLSGYGGALLAQRASAAGVNRVLSKPVQQRALTRALAELLHTA